MADKVHHPSHPHFLEEFALAGSWCREWGCDLNPDTLVGDMSFLNCVSTLGPNAQAFYFIFISFLMIIYIFERQGYRETKKETTIFYPLVPSPDDSNDQGWPVPKPRASNCSWDSYMSSGAYILGPFFFS